jgi:uncharacterized protein YneF (UPF0154 family)
MSKDIVKLLILLVIVVAIIVGITIFGKSVDNKTKYQHPITRPGARW